MATISDDIQLIISVIGGGTVATNKAEVKCTINFTPFEVAANNEYHVRAHLWEEDEERDLYAMNSNGYVLKKQGIGDQDDPVGFIQFTFVRPNGNASIDVTLSREWDFHDLDDVPPVMEKFFATVSVVPRHLYSDWKFSPVANVDVG